MDPRLLVIVGGEENLGVLVFSETKQGTMITIL